MKRSIKALARNAVCVIALGMMSVAGFAQTTLPPQLTQGAHSDVPVAIQQLRWAMNDEDVNALTFRSMDTLFTTRSVPHSGNVWELQRDDHP